VRWLAVSLVDRRRKTRLNRPHNVTSTLPRNYKSASLLFADISSQRLYRLIAEAKQAIPSLRHFGVKLPPTLACGPSTEFAARMLKNASSKAFKYLINMPLHMSAIQRPASAMPPMAAELHSRLGALLAPISAPQVPMAKYSGNSMYRSSRGLHITCAALQDPSIEAPSPLPPPAAAQAHGHIEVVVGPMFAGKTSELLRRVAGYEDQGLKVAIVKSNKDTRYSGSHVVTHDGLQKAS